MKKLTFVLTLASAAALASCTHEAADTLAPVVNITDPLNMDMYHNGDTIFIRGNVSDNDDLHELYIGIHTAADTLFSAAPTVHSMASYDIDTLWVVTGIAATTNAKFQVIAADHHDNIDTTQINLQLMP